MTAELIFVGTELLLGDILNTNAQYISKKLAESGMTVLFQQVVGDNEERIKETVEAALERADLVITTGGLGPTADDLTKEVCADLLDLPLEEDPGIASKIEAYFRKKNIEMPGSNLKQALVPKGSVIIENENGTAPGFLIEKGGKKLLILPGPPREMKPMLESALKECLLPKKSGTIVSDFVRTFGIGESAMAEAVSDLLESENPTVAPYAKNGEALLRVTSRAETEEECETISRPIIDEIKRRLGKYIYGINAENIETAAVEILKEKGITVSTAESCTGGLLAKRITDVPGASEIFSHGVVTYSDEAKEELLSVEKSIIDEYFAVSKETAARMAERIRSISDADIGVSVTGLAGPDGDGSGNEVGTIYIGIASKRGTRVKELRTGQTGPGCREFNREVAASNALNEIRKEAIELYEQHY